MSEEKLWTKDLESVIELLSDKCGCESGGGAADLEPGFTCKTHQILFAVSDRGRALERVFEAAKAFQEPEYFFDNSWREKPEAQALYKALAELEKGEKGGG